MCIFNFSLKILSSVPTVPEIDFGPPSAYFVHGFSWFQVDFSWFFMVQNWFYMVLHDTKLVFHGFYGFPLVFMIFNGFS